MYSSMMSLEQVYGLKPNRVLTNLIFDTAYPEFVLKILFPIVPVDQFGGLVIEFNSLDFEEYDDDRAPGATYKEIQTGSVGSRAYTLQTKGLRYPMPKETSAQLMMAGIEASKIASNGLMLAGARKLEIEQARIATNINFYAPSNRIILAGGSQFQNNIDPGPIIRQGKAAVAHIILKEPNVLILGRSVFRALEENPVVRYTLQRKGLDALTTSALGDIYGFDKVVICESRVRDRQTGQIVRLFDTDLVMAYTNPLALNADVLPYRPDAYITFYQPSYGYTYTYREGGQIHPIISNMYLEPGSSTWYHNMDYHRRPVLTGVDKDSGLIISGYIIKNAAAPYIY